MIFFYSYINTLSTCDNKVNRINAARFTKKPIFTMSFTFKYPVPNTTALAGVAIGIIKQQLEAIVIGIANNRISIFSAEEIVANMGKKIAVNARLLTSSVKNNIAKISRIVIKVNPK